MVTGRDLLKSGRIDEFFWASGRPSKSNLILSFVELLPQNRLVEHDWPMVISIAELPLNSRTEALRLEVSRVNG